MSSSRIRHYIYSVLIVAGGLSSHSGLSQDRGRYALALYASAGGSVYTGYAGTAPGVNSIVSRVGPAGTIRLLWHTDHHLRIGIETGWTKFYSYRLASGARRGDVHLTGIPALMVFSMPLTPRLLVTMAPGGYLLTSRLDYDGRVKSTKLSLGFMAATAYILPVNRRVSVGAELKFYNARETKDAALSLQLMLIWKLLDW